MRVIGLMSGTSMDGIDASLLETDGEQKIQEIAYCSLNYDADFKRLLKATEAKAPFSTVDPQLVTKSTELHAEMVNRLLKQTAFAARDIDLIGYHGQTLWHAPKQKKTLQIGDGALLAKLTGITVIDQFRARDLAEGGQGAPFAPLFHQALAIRDQHYPAVIINCGGIANLTFVAGPKLDEVWGYDAGPGNVLLDRYLREYSQQQCFMDTDGKFAAAGKVDAFLFHQLWETHQSLITQKPPKSFDSSDWQLPEVVASLAKEDVCRTLAAFTVVCLLHSIDFIPSAKTPDTHWIVAGGGFNNPVIKQLLQQGLSNKFGFSIQLQNASQLNWNSTSLEAQLFAYFAVRSVKNLPLSVPQTTGVVKPVSGGVKHLPD